MDYSREARLIMSKSKLVLLLSKGEVLKNELSGATFVVRLKTWILQNTNLDYNKFVPFSTEELSRIWAKRNRMNSTRSSASESWDRNQEWREQLEPHLLLWQLVLRHPHQGRDSWQTWSWVSLAVRSSLAYSAPWHLAGLIIHSLIGESGIGNLLYCLLRGPLFPWRVHLPFSSNFVECYLKS